MFMHAAGLRGDRARERKEDLLGLPQAPAEVGPRRHTGGRQRLGHPPPPTGQPHGFGDPRLRRRTQEVVELNTNDPADRDPSDARQFGLEALDTR